ncbi:hypothetical protein SLITO_v1c05010 [Spiroplasma litorale]|uniref:Uncharacterized protein n=1 Tax=Spiroplasma litorale TaxID=216942 RepID=A0A0K1W224_9MOLU|nr:hypothetical protein [Spiroplasma litorale]AKX34152.1 hypothetical protein SLITO_v1c05010 [Spiroplasma litorale]
MEKIINLKEFVNNISVQWFVNFFMKKINLIKNNFLDENNGETIGFKPNINVANFYLTTIKEELDNIKDYNTMQKFLKKHNFYKLKNDDLKMFSDQASSEIMETLDKDGKNLEEKLTELIIKMQINNISKNLSNSISIFKILLKKLGEETLINEIDFDDVTYLINNSYNESLERFKNWSLQNSKQSINYQEELKILDSDVDFDKKREASEIIEHYFNSIISNDIDDNEINDFSSVTDINKSKIVVFNKGIMSCEELCSKINLISYLFKNENNLFKR